MDEAKNTKQISSGQSGFDMFASFLTKYPGKTSPVNSPNNSINKSNLIRRPKKTNTASNVVPFTP